MRLARVVKFIWQIQLLTSILDCVKKITFYLHSKFQKFKYSLHFDGITLVLRGWSLFLILGDVMTSKLRRSVLIGIIISVSLFLGSEVLCAATTAPEKGSSKPAGVTKPPDSLKKGEKIIIKGREYCYECIDNSECLGCHTKISERKFAQSVHGANSCNSCHWDITDVKAHGKAKGGRIHTEPVTCHRCHKKEGADHYASAHFINDIQCKDCHKDIHEMTPWKGDKVRVIQKCHADKEMMERNKVFLIATQTYYESYHGKVEHLGYPKLVAGCADCHGFHSILPPDNPKSLISEGRLVETCGKCHPGANTNFVLWIAHATHNDPEREPVLYGTFVLMTALLVAVFGIFWLHTFLWC